MITRPIFGIIFASVMLAGCASERRAFTDDFFDYPLKYDNRILVNMVIYPVDDGEQGQYRFCWEACSIDEAHEAHYLFGYWPCCFIIPRVPGEFKGWDGNRRVHVSARFDAHCYRPKAVCADLAYDWFYEVK